MMQRERVITALRREKPDKTPKALNFTKSAYKIFVEKTGIENYREYFGIESREIMLNPTKKKADYLRYFKEPLGADTWIDPEWGIGNVPGSQYHFTRYLHPLQDLNTVNELEEYPFPDFKEAYRYEGIPEKVRQMQASGLFVLGGVYDVFEPAWYLRGMEKLFEDFMTNPEFASYLLDKITDMRCFMAEKFAKIGVDMILLGDDVGTQRGMLMHPDMWREWLKPRLKKIVDAGREINKDIFVYYHTDGNVEPIIPELIEVGVDVLNPVQPECMDPIKLKNLYGNKLSFWGTIGTQTTMPFGSTQEVMNEVKIRIETVGKNGGLVISPTHVIEPDVPPENILAFFEAIEKYG